jgi:hypothetical protein
MFTLKLLALAFSLFAIATLPAAAQPNEQDNKAGAQISLPGLGLGAALGAISALVGAYIGAYHRTRGARRELAAEATRRAMLLVMKSSPTPDALNAVRIQAELFFFYFNAIKISEHGLDSSGPLTPTDLSYLIQKHLPDLSNQSASAIQQRKRPAEDQGESS